MAGRRQRLRRWGRRGARSLRGAQPSLGFAVFAAFAFALLFVCAASCSLFAFKFK